MLTIHHVPGTRSIRVLWTCAELGLEHQVVTIDFAPSYRFSPEWLRMNPVGKVPALSDGDLTMFESGAMVQYILDRYGAGRLQPPAGTPAHAHYLQWSWFAEATLARPLGEIVNHRREFGDRASPAAIEEMQQRARRCVKAIDDALAGRDYLVENRFTAADIMTGYSLMLWERLAPCDDYPRASAYWARLRERPGCVYALQAGAGSKGPLS